MNRSPRPPESLGPPLAPFSARTTAVVVLLAALLPAVRALLWSAEASERPSDFAQIWFAARAIVDGNDPYALIGPGMAFEWPGSFYYPLPAAVLAIPLAPLPLALANAVFVGIAGGLLAWALARFGVTGLLMLASPSALMALQLGQWSPLLTAALLMPALGVILIAKPTIGAAIFVTRPTWWAVAGGLLLLALSLILQPTWVLRWWEALHSTDVVGGDGLPYRAPLFWPGGFVLLLALLRWRRMDARLLLALSSVPQTPIIYEMLPLLLVARSTVQVAWFVVAGYLILVLVDLGRPYPTVPDEVAAGMPFILWLMYVPALLMVLSRSNEGALPANFKAVLSRWSLPAWLRGTDSAPARAPQADQQPTRGARGQL